MQSNEVAACMKIAACVCGKDGVISEVELKKMFEMLSAEFPGFQEQTFDQLLDEFFNEDPKIEDLLTLINGEDLRRFTLSLSEASAAADGLDVRENIALTKVCKIWGIDRDA